MHLPYVLYTRPSFFFACNVHGYRACLYMQLSLLVRRLSNVLRKASQYHKALGHVGYFNTKHTSHQIFLTPVRLLAWPAIEDMNNKLL